MHSSAGGAAGNASVPILDLGACQAVGPDGTRGAIAPQQFALLFALTQLPVGDVLTYRDAVATVYGAHAARDWALYLGALQGTARRLRVTLRAAGWSPPPIETLRFYGLYLTQPVAVVGRQADGSGTAVTLPPTAVY